MNAVPAATPAPQPRLIAPSSVEWPDQFDDLPEPPTQLWLAGTGHLAELASRAVTLVGSRAATAYGEHVSADFSHALAASGLSIVAGGGYGIEAAAHRAALAARGATIAVLACGLDRLYPTAHTGLFEHVIASGGLLVSEYEPGTNPTRTRFAARNRLLAALAPVTVVIEAARRSGAIQVATHAKNLHRSVLAVPGPITSATSTGCHTLLREHRATLATSAQDVLAHLPQPAPPGTNPTNTEQR